MPGRATWPTPMDQRHCHTRARPTCPVCRFPRSHPRRGPRATGALSVGPQPGESFLTNSLDIERPLFACRFASQRSWETVSTRLGPTRPCGQPPRASGDHVRARPPPLASASGSRRQRVVSTTSGADDGAPRGSTPLAESQPAATFHVKQPHPGSRRTPHGWVHAIRVGWPQSSGRSAIRGLERSEWPTLRRGTPLPASARSRRQCALPAAGRIISRAPHLRTTKGGW